VTARSSNAALLPDSEIAISAGCGVDSLTCTMTLAAVAGQTGSATISLSVADTHGQSAAATATLEVKAAVAPEPGTGNTSGGGSPSKVVSNEHGRGGGGSMELLSLLVGLVLLATRPYGCRAARRSSAM
jgi:hypothetical protein